MLRLLQGIFTLVGFVVSILLAVYYFRQPIASAVMRHWLQEKVGLKSSFEKADLLQGKTGFVFENVELTNPGQFTERRFISIPKLELELDPDALQTGRLSFPVVRVEVAEMVVIRTNEAGTNIEALPAMTRSAAEISGVQTVQDQYRLYDFEIKSMILSAKKVLYYDYTTNPSPTPVAFPANIEGLEIRGLANSQEVVRAIVGAILKRTPIQIPNLPMRSIEALLPKTLSSSATVAAPEPEPETESVVAEPLTPAPPLAPPLVEPPVPVPPEIPASLVPTQETSPAVPEPPVIPPIPPAAP